MYTTPATLTSIQHVRLLISQLMDIGSNGTLCRQRVDTGWRILTMAAATSALIGAMLLIGISHHLLQVPRY